jgi:crossover junction endodeoxyribonuclease RuvC
MMAVETIFYQRNVRSALKLAHARGVALLVAAEMGLAVSEYSPAEVKRATVGYGQATKVQVGKMMVRLFGLSREERQTLSDASDALAVALCHLNASRTRFRTHASLSSMKYGNSSPEGTS